MVVLVNKCLNGTTCMQPSAIRCTLLIDISYHPLIASCIVLTAPPESGTSLIPDRIAHLKFL